MADAIIYKWSGNAKALVCICCKNYETPKTEGFFVLRDVSTEGVPRAHC